jgi:hypothetical protein
MTQDHDLKPNGGADNKPDVKPTLNQLKKKKEVLPEGRVGTLVIMKSGKVKLVFGEDIVMNVGLSSSLSMDVPLTVTSGDPRSTDHVLTTASPP